MFRTLTQSAIIRSKFSLPKSVICRALQTNTNPPQDLHAFGVKHINHGIGRITEGIMVKGEGSWVLYDDGRKMLDFTCGIGVTNLGHAHPKVSKAAAEQCMQLVHAQCGIAMHEPYVRLIEQLLPAMPHPSLDSFFFWNSGSEAVEAAVKMARVFTGRQNIISMQGSYHGRTFGAMALTKSKTIYSAGAHPLMPGVFSIPFPYWRQQNSPHGTSDSVLTSNALYQLELLLKQQTSPTDTAAIIVEPVLGEGGYVPAPPEFLQGLRQVCDQHGIILIVDEVQSGFCRTGDWFAIEQSGVKPDILVMAKGLGNGFPISGVVSRRGLTDSLAPGFIGGTYAGNVVSCAAAGAVAGAMREENILANVRARSSELFAFLNNLKDDPIVGSHIADVRGRGLMVGVEFTGPVNGIASKVASKCIEKGMLILTTSVYEVIRFIPPLNITKDDLKKGCDIFAGSIREVVENN